jgi:hypothetical protein
MVKIDPLYIKPGRFNRKHFEGQLTQILISIAAGERDHKFLRAQDAFSPEEKFY